MANTIGRNIKELRKSKHWSQQLLADSCNFDRSLVSKWEDGTRVPNKDTLEKIATFFSVNAEDIVYKTIVNDNTGGFNIMENGITKISTEEGIELLSIGGMIIPKVNLNETGAYKALEKAYAIEAEPKEKVSPDRYVEMCHLYQTAFDGGIMAAGVNLLGHLFITAMKAILSGSKVNDHIMERMRYIVEALEDFGDPAGEYYDAMIELYITSHGEIKEPTEDDTADDCPKGIAMIYELAEAGNPYAEKFIEQLDQDTSIEEMPE